MAPPADTPERGTGRSNYTRRTVLRASGVALGASVTGGVAGAQDGNGTGNGTETEGATSDGITTMGVIPEQEDLEQDVVGFWVHLGPEVDPVQSSIADQCDIVDWADEETMAFDARLVDRTADPEEQSITLYLHDAVDVDPGTLFIVNDRVSCESGYAGVELEQMGARDIGVGVANTETDGGGGEADPGGNEDGAGDDAGGEDGGGGATGGGGAGFGVLAAVAGLLGGGWLLGRDSEE